MSFDLVALVIANMVGVGVFTTSGLALQSVPDPWVLMALWGLGGVYAVVGAIAYGGLARARPDNGGEHHLLRSLGLPAWGFAAGVVSLTAGFAGPLAAAAHGLDAYLGPGTGAAVLLGFGVLHTSRAGLGLRLQTTAVVAKLTLVVVVVTFAALRAGPTLPTSGGPVGPSAMFAVFVWITFSYTGFNAAVYLAGEHPPGQVARAGVVGALGVTVLYLLLNASFVLAQPTASVVGRADVAVAAAAFDGSEAVLATRILAGTALVTSVSSLAVAGGRVVQSMARAGDLGTAMVRLGDQPGPGVAAISALAGVAYVVAGLPEILGVAGWMLAGSSTLVVGAGLWRGVYPDAGSRVAAGGFCGGTLAVLVGSAQHAPAEAAIALGTFGVAGVAHRLVRPRRATTRRSRRRGGAGHRR